MNGTSLKTGGRQEQYETKVTPHSLLVWEGRAGENRGDSPECGTGGRGRDDNNLDEDETRARRRRKTTTRMGGEDGKCDNDAI